MPGSRPATLAFGAAVRAARAATGISQEELAHRAGLHRTYVGGIERGERNPTITNVFRLADALMTRPSALVAKAESLIDEPGAKTRNRSSG